MNVPLPITVTGFEVATVSTTDEVIKERDRLLGLSRKGNTITSADGAERAANLLRELTEFKDGIEAAHKKAKAPVLEATRQIDSLKHTLADEIVIEVDRLSRIIGTWNSEQDRLARLERQKAADREQAIIDEAHRKAAAEKKRLADEQAALDAKAAEEKRLADAKLAEEKAALERQQREAKDEAEFERIKAEQDRIDAEFAESEKARAAKLEADQAAARDAATKASEAHVETVEHTIAVNRVSAAGLVATKTEGTSTRVNYEFEVTSITQLYEANPLLVVMTPNKAAIKNALKMLDAGQHIPGLKHWKSAKASVKAAE